MSENTDIEVGLEKTRSAVDVGEETLNQGDEPTGTPRDSLPLWKWVLVLIGLYLGAVLYGKLTCTSKISPTNFNKGLDTTVAADVQGPIYQRFGNIKDLPWVGLGFPMASVATILPFDRAYGLFNIKVLLLSSIATFEIGSALCGAAPSINSLIVGRVIAGIGGAGMYLG